MFCWVCSLFSVSCSRQSASMAWSPTWSRNARRSRHSRGTGATPADILKLVVVNGCSLGLLGSLVGLVGAVAVRGVLSSQTYGVSASDPLTLAATVVGLMIVAALASAVPAWRALGINPVSALRGD